MFRRPVLLGCPSAIDCDKLDHQAERRAKGLAVPPSRRSGLAAAWIRARHSTNTAPPFTPYRWTQQRVVLAKCWYQSKIFSTPQRQALTSQQAGIYDNPQAL